MTNETFLKRLQNTALSDDDLANATGGAGTIGNTIHDFKIGDRVRFSDDDACDFPMTVVGFDDHYPYYAYVEVKPDQYPDSVYKLTPDEIVKI